MDVWETFYFLLVVTKKSFMSLSQAVQLSLGDRVADWDWQLTQGRTKRLAPQGRVPWFNANSFPDLEP